MKVMIIEGRYTEKIVLPDEIIKKLPKNLVLAASVQYLDALPDIAKQLTDAGTKTLLFQGWHSKHPGQVVGCDIIPEIEADAVLYIGDGLFHPKTFVLKANKPVHCYFPGTGEYKIITQKDVEHIVQRHHAARIKFLDAKTIGVLITTKYGQRNLAPAIALKKRLKGKKTVVLFLADVLDWNDLENYPFIDVWINTMCPRISYDDQQKFRKMVIDIEDVFELLHDENPSFSLPFLAARAKK